MESLKQHQYLFVKEFKDCIYDNIIDTNCLE